MTQLLCKGCTVRVSVGAAPFSLLLCQGSSPARFPLQDQVPLGYNCLMLYSVITMDYLMHSNFISMHYYVMHYNSNCKVACYDVLK